MECKIVIDDSSIKDILITAFEGGSNYWYQINNDYTGHPADAVMKSEETLEIGDVEEDGRKLGILNREEINKGLQVMIEKYPSHFTNFINDNGDAETADVFLQCCVMGEIVFG